MYKIKADVELFKRGKQLAIATGSLSSIVQNDMEITEEDVQEFNQHIDKLLSDIEAHRRAVNEYILRSNQ